MCLEPPSIPSSVSMALKATINAMRQIEPERKVAAREPFEREIAAQRELSDLRRDDEHDNRRAQDQDAGRRGEGLVFTDSRRRSPCVSIQMIV